MFKIKKIKFNNNPILGNLELDFCGIDGKAVDTVILAGENGTGKSTIIEQIYRIASHTVNSELVVDFENDKNNFTIRYYWKKRTNDSPLMYADDGKGMNVYIGTSDIKNRYNFNGVFSDVDINFSAKDISAVTSLTLDSQTFSRRSSSELPTQIKQLLIDIQALDDADLAQAARKNLDVVMKDLDVKERMPRFTQAFNQVFEDLTYYRVENNNNKKAVMFKKYDKEVSIDSLSSGEKQIVFRGCFLLKDVNATNGAFVFIDEPEISLHPVWQSKIMDYYKNIFTDQNGKQTSQIFAVTHSPFVIHNENRKNDKVIVLKRNKEGNIVSVDKPEYYKCNSVESVQEAFSIQGFSNSDSFVYLEGRTDEKYFNKVVKVFDIITPFKFKWVGHIDANGQEVNTGDAALKKAYLFLISQNLSIKNVCLFDCDTKHQDTEKDNVYARTIKEYENTKSMNKGIENALILDDVDTSAYYDKKIKKGDYGAENTICEFQKMKFCDYICSLPNEELKLIFANLKSEMMCI